MSALAALLAEHSARLRNRLLDAHPRAPVVPGAAGPTLAAWAAVAGVTPEVIRHHRRRDPELAALPTQGRRVSVTPAPTARAQRARELRAGAPRRTPGRKPKTRVR